jgi:hypothetical protein
VRKSDAFDLLRLRDYSTKETFYRNVTFSQRRYEYKRRRFARKVALSFKAGTEFPIRVIRPGRNKAPETLNGEEHREQTDIAFRFFQK